MSLLDLKPNKGARKAARRIGRGNGSGKGTYCGRGVKGQGARAGGGKRPGFEGGQTPLSQRLPKLPGFKNPNRVNFLAINVGTLNEYFNDGEEVNIDTLNEKGLITRKNRPVKILGNGELTKKLNVTIERVSESAQKKIEGAKGSFTELMTPKIKTSKKEKQDKMPKKEVETQASTKDKGTQEIPKAEKTLKPETAPKETKAEEPETREEV